MNIKPNKKYDQNKTDRLYMVFCTQHLFSPAGACLRLPFGCLCPLKLQQDLVSFYMCIHHIIIPSACELLILLNASNFSYQARNMLCTLTSLFQYFLNKTQPVVTSLIISILFYNSLHSFCFKLHSATNKRTRIYLSSFIYKHLHLTTSLYD